MRIQGKPTSSGHVALGVEVEVGTLLVKDGGTYRLGTSADDLKGLDSVDDVNLGNYAFAAEVLTGDEGIQMGVIDNVATKRLERKIALYLLGEKFIMSGVKGGTGRKSETLSAGDKMTINDGQLEKYTASSTDAGSAGVYDYIVAEDESDATATGAATLNFLASYPVLNVLVASGT